MPASHVQMGWNTVELQYLNQYNTNRVGLHTYTDEGTGEQFLYTQFEAFHCYHVFPVFDQPSLKAKMRLTVLCPEDWLSVSNSIERHFLGQSEAQHVLERHDIWQLAKFLNNTYRVYEFEQTPRISCYLYAVCAGPFETFEDNDPMYPPQRVYVRKSMIDYMRHEMVFGVTKTTIDQF